MLKDIYLFLILISLFVSTPSIAIAGDLDVQWNKKTISIKAIDVTLCEVLKKIGEKTNTKIQNNGKCDFPVKVNVTKVPITDALKKLLRRDSYVFVDNKTERKLLILNPKTSDSSEDTRDFSANRNKSIEQTEIQPPQYQESDTTVTSYVDPTGELNPIPYPSEPPFDPELVENAVKEGLPPPDPYDAAP